MSKTLLLSEVFPPQVGGSGRWFAELYGRLPREEYIMAVGEHPHSDDFDRDYDREVVRLALAMPTWGVRSLQGLQAYRRVVADIVELVRRHRVRMIHCARILQEGWVAWLIKKWLGIPYLFYVHGEELACGRASRELAWMMRRVIRGANLIIANTENSKAALIAGWNVPASHVRVLHPGVNAEQYVPQARCAATRTRLGWDDRPTILTAGRLQRRKGHDQLIAAMSRVRQRAPDALYSIVGAGDEEASLRSLVRDRGLTEHVQFCGEVGEKELLERFQQCDLFVLPNRDICGDIEGFGIVLLEAQACGKPVIAGNSGGTRETLRPGHTGLLVDCTSPEPLANAVCELLGDQDRMSHMGSAAREWVVGNFSWDSLVNEATDIFRQAISSDVSQHRKRTSLLSCSSRPAL